MAETNTTAPAGEKTEQAYGFNGVLAAVQSAENDRGAYKVLLVARENRSTLPVILFGKLIAAFDQGAYEIGSPIRVYGPFKGHHTLKTAEFGSLDVQALRATWLGRPDPNRFKTAAAPHEASHARAPAPITAATEHTAAAPPSAGDPFGAGGFDDDIPF